MLQFLLVLISTVLIITSSAAAMSPKIKLTYFDIEGAGEPTRLALALSETKYEDVRIKFPEWKDLKPKTPYGNLPVMEIDDGPVKTQSGAMLRWVGAECSDTLYPRDKLYDIEEAIGVIGDLQKAWEPCLYLAMRPQAFGYEEDFPKTEKGKELIKSMREKFVKNDLPNYLGRIEGLIDKSGGKWLVAGDHPTIADCMAVALLRGYTRGHIDHIDTKCLETNPKIVDYCKRFCDLPQIKGRYDSGIGSAAY
jgi:glutathione S-transferase